jgi:mannose-6-phosphate isomerase-like protein (cupin superfamily)
LTFPENIEMKINKINLTEKFNLVDKYWSPAIAGKLNGQLVKLAKLKGEFTLHKHDLEDELFLVIEGNLKIELETETLEISEGEFVIIPKGVLHKPIAEEEVKVVLFEPETTINTGDTENEFTLKKLKHI